MSRSAPDHRATSERQVLAGAARLAEQAHRDLRLTPPPELAQPAAAARHLQAIADEALARLSESERRLDANMCMILLSALELERDLRRHLLKRRSARRVALQRGLDRLRPVPDPAALLERVCDETLHSCGMRRALLSRIGDGVWSPWKSAQSDPDPERAEAWNSIDPIAIEDLPLEAGVAQHRRPLLVAHPDDEPRIHPVLRRLTDAPFIVVPIAPSDAVIGLLHVDRYGEKRTVDTDDREVAWAFAEGFGRIYERAVYRQRLDDQRRLVQIATGRQGQSTSELDPTIELLPSGIGESDIYVAPREMRSPPGLLTDREHEVAALMAAGFSNEQIGERLVITRATAKSHMRSILRKLGAANRSQAIAVYLRHGPRP
jgi:DNA-binding CsgD family transcriptional regulator